MKYLAIKITRCAKTLSSSLPRMNTMSAESISSDSLSRSSNNLGTPARALSAGRPAVVPSPPTRDPILDFFPTGYLEISNSNYDKNISKIVYDKY